ncbi:dienelactone hydrolase family protein [Rhodoferax sp.]|uniref:dienelactone hydrolase family protein n=1 Tax=Rhodoferax sp. TaxID=50421 RepID=UPI0027789DBD|nr:dienelactone hydrolase family protein [Rhodoferax sp.]
MSTQLGEVVRIPVGLAHIEGMLALPQPTRGVVLFAHGSGSSRHSPRNNFVAQVLRESGFGTFLMDLLTPAEEAVYQTRFDIVLLARRLMSATRWLQADPICSPLPLGYFGASTGAAAALQAAARLGPAIGAVVSRGGRPDLAGRQELSEVQCPTLLLVGGDDDVVIELNRQALALLRCEKVLSIIAGATHLFEEPGTLEQVARQAAAWFDRYLLPASAPG